MRKLVFPILLSFFVGACGKHSNENSGFIKTGLETRGEKPVTLPARMSQAVKSGDYAEMEQVLAQGLAVDSLLDSGRTALIEAIALNLIDVVDWLLKKGADPKVRDQEGQDAFDHAQDRPAILRILNPVSESDDVKKLFAAIETGNHAEVKRLLQSGVSADLENAEGETPLTHAVKKEQGFVVRVLVQMKVNANKRNRKGESPLGIAIEMKLGDIEKLLRRGGATEV